MAMAMALAMALAMAMAMALAGYGDGYGDGDGYGSGYGYGDGSGDGDGDGYGDGSGDGDGDGYGDGDGSGYGYGIPEFNGEKVWQIDSVATIIDHVHGNYAVGRILNSDFTLTPCYVAKVGDYFAHGDTLQQAFRDAEAKALENEPIEDRIKRFRQLYHDPDVKIPARELYDWHHVLTGSCETGRNTFARDHAIDIDSQSFTVREFVTLTCNSYGSQAILQLAAAYGIFLNNNH